MANYSLSPFTICRFASRSTVSTLALLMTLLTAASASAKWKEAGVGPGFPPPRGNYPVITLDPHGVTHFVYVRLNRADLKHVSFTPSGHRTLETIATATSTIQGLALAADASSFLHLAAVQSSGLMYTSWDGKTWAPFQTVDLAGAVSATIVADHGNAPHIAYLQNDQFGNSILKHATFDGSAWNIETLPTAIFQHLGLGAIAIATDGTIHVAYTTNAFSSGLCDASKPPLGFWTSQCGIYFGGALSMTLDLQGNPQMALVDGNSNLLHVSLVGSTWSSEIVDTNVRNYADTGIGVDAAGVAKISYVRSSARRGALDGWEYATNAGGSWQTAEVDFSPDPINAIGLSLDTAGLPHMTASSAQFMVYGYLKEPAVSVTWQSLTQSVDKSGKAVLSGTLAITNLGNSTAGGFAIRYYQSTDITLDSGDTLIATKSLECPGSGKTQTVSFQSTLPASASGEYVIASITHPAESDTAKSGAAQLVP